MCPQPVTELNHYYITKIILFPHINKQNSFLKLLTSLVYMICFTWVCYISFNKGEEGIGHYVIRVGTIPPYGGGIGYMGPLPRCIPPTYSDILT